jgi:hypothetical protein
VPVYTILAAIGKSSINRSDLRFGALCGAIRGEGGQDRFANTSWRHEGGGLGFGHHENSSY